MNPAEANVKDEAAPRPRARRPRTLPPLPFTALCREDDIADDVTVLRLPVPKRGGIVPAEWFPGKRYELTADGLVEKRDGNRAQWFAAESYAVGCIDSFHAARERARLACSGRGPGCLVPGAVAPGVDHRSMPRSKTAEAAKRDAAGRVVQRGRPAGLVDARRHWIILDLDGVPSGGIDPRRDPAGALARIRAMLPPELARARTSWLWSSSCCLRRADKSPLRCDAPETVGAHLAFWLDEALDELGRKALMARLAAWVAERCPGAVVDRAVAIWNQAIFCAVSLEGGLEDPFPGALRSGLLDGKPVVCVADLLAELPELAAQPQRPSRRLSDEERAARETERKAAREAQKARRAHDSLLRGAARQRSPKAGEAPCRAEFVRRDPPRKRISRGKAAAIAAKKATFRPRALEDIVALVDGRRETDPAWRDGLPDGYRTRTMWAVAALLSWLEPVDRLEAEIERYAVHLAGRVWYDNRWLAGNKGARVVELAGLAAAAEAAGGDGSALREDRCRTALMNLLSPTREEQEVYGLRALRSEAVRSRARRAARGAATEEERREAQRATSARATKPWEAEGVSRATWYARRRAERPAGAAPKEAGLTSDAVALLADTVDAAVTGDRAAAKRAMRGIRAPGFGAAVARLGSVADALELVAFELPADEAASVSAALGAFRAIENAARAGAGADAVVRYALEAKGIAFAARAARFRGRRIATPGEVVELAGAAPDARTAAMWLREWAATGIRPALPEAAPARAAAGRRPALW